jgi:hypothetical protein
MRTHEVDSVADAVALARELRDRGEYDWFRGQTVNWRVRASISRLPVEAQEEAWKDLDRFDQWCQAQPALREQSETADSTIAIAQHYGMPTTFVDFTTEPEVAGFFASDGREAEVRKRQEEIGCDKSVILLVNTKEVVETTGDWARALSDPNRQVRCLTLDVSNLWRLDAQRGVFMDLRYTDFEADYPFDRILFPFDPEGAAPGRRSYYYPTRKSRLEQVIDHHFAEAGVRRQQPEILRAMAAAGLGSPESPLHVSNQAQADMIHQIEPDLAVVAGNRTNPFLSEDAIDLSRLTPAPGWAEALADPGWALSVDEDYDLTRTDLSATLEVPPEIDAPACRDRVAEQVRERLREREDLRSLLVNWEADAPGAERDRVEEATNAAIRIWDGMRRLPWSDRQLADALGVVVALLLCCPPPERASLAAKNRSIAALIPDATMWEFGLETGSYNRGWASMAALTSAMRSDVRELFVPEEARWSESLHGAVQAIRTPRFLFRFDAFAEIVATQLIPTQLAMRAGEVTFFSPLDFVIFGFA